MATRITFIIISIVLSAYSIHAQICQPLSKPTPHMGAHPRPEFTNCWNMLNSHWGGLYGSANFGTTGGGHAMVFIDKDGWPKNGLTHKFMISLDLSENITLKVAIGDVFKCRYKGSLSQLGNGTQNQVFSSGSLQNVVSNNGYVNFEIKVNRLSDAIRFEVRNKISEIQIMRPGYELDDPRIVTDEQVALLKGVKVLRFLHQSGSNQTLEREWKYRTPANAPFEMYVENDGNNDIADNNLLCFTERASNPFLSNSINNARGQSWEKAIDICNYLDVDLYANVPVLADLEYMRELGKLMKQRLKPTLNVYIEIGNELWNFGGGGAFLGFAMLMPAIHDMVVTQGDRTILGNVSKGIELEDGNVGNGAWWNNGNGAGQLNAYVAMRRWPAYRLKQFMEEFAKSWGFADQGGVGVRARAVLAGQLAYGWGTDYWFIGNEGVSFLEKQFGYGTAKKYLYALAITHYTNVHASDDESTESIRNKSVADIFKDFYDETSRQFGEFGVETQGSNREGNELEDILAYAKRYGLKAIAYEGGHECNVQRDGAWLIMNNAVAAYNDPKMYEHTKFTMNKWYSWMGYDALFIKNEFSIQATYGAGYGVAQYEGHNSQQLRAYREIMNNPSPSLTRERGGVIGAGPTARTELPAWKIASYDADSKRRAESGNVNRRLDGTIESTKDVYIIRNETGGGYGLRLKMAWIQANAKYNIYMDGKLVHTWNLGVFRPNPYSDQENEKPRWSDTLKFEIPYGTHSIHFTKLNSNAAESNLDLVAFEYTLLNELPPSKPQYIYGDLEVCNGNTNAKYEVSPVDFSVCDYEWVLPASASTAKILPLDTKPPVSGQGTYLIYVDWGNTPNGTYDLKVRGKNQSKLPGNAWLIGEWRDFKVTVKPCGFTVNPTPVCLNSKVTFTPDGLPPNIVSYRWDSGDKESGTAGFTTKTDASPFEYTYKKAGVYDINLTVTTQTTPDGPKTTIPFFNKVNVTSCNAPTVVTPLTYCQGQTGVSAVTATAVNGGTGLKWYTAATGWTALANAPTPTTLTAGTQSYFVSQMNGTKESDRTKLEVIISAAPAAPTVNAPASVTYCKDALGKVSDLTSKVTSTGTATLKWYESNASTTSSASPAVPVTSVEGTKQVYVSQAIGTCESPKAPINIVITAPPAAPTVTGTVADKCLNAPVAASELTSLVTAATGKTIQWHISESSAGTANPSTINTASIGTKSVWASQKEGECQSAKIKIDIVVTDGPAQYAVGGGGVTDCNSNLGQAVTLSNSTSGVNYVLMLGSVPKDTLVGSGTSLSFAPQTEAGTYVVLATSIGNCQSTMTGNAKLTNAVAPTQQTLTGGGAIECGGAGKTLTLGSTESGVTYLLIKDGKDTVDTKVGNGATQGFSGIQAPGKYSVRATRGTCETSMTDGEELTNPTPVKVFDLSSTGKLDCSGAGSVTVAISSSEQGVEYTLYNGTAAVGSKQIATSTAPINFTNIKLGGTYTIKALNPATKCVADMTGSKLVVVPQIPIVQTLSGGGSYCEGETAPILRLQNSELDVTYTLKTGSGTSQTIKDTKTGTGAGFDFAPQTESNSYTVTASKGVGTDACTKEMSSGVRIEKLPPSVGGTATAAQAQIARGENTDISINGQTGTITWETSTDGTNFAPIVPAQTNTTINTGALAAAGDYYYKAKVRSGTCTPVYSTIVKVNVIIVNKAGIASVPMDTICQGGTATLTVANSNGLIQWQDSIAGGTFKDILNATNTTYSTPSLTQTTSYRVKVGTDYSNAVKVTTLAAPSGNITGSANATAACEDNGAGYELTISPINTTASYALYKDGQEQLNAVISNGKFTNLKQQGNYIVKASLTQLPSCMSTMIGSFVIAAPKLPEVFKVTGGGSACAGAIGGQADILLSNSEVGVSYALSDQTNIQVGTGGKLTFPKTLTVGNAGTYTIVALNTSTQCAAQMDGGAEISIKSGVGVPTVIADNSYCNQTPATIAVSVDNATDKVWSIAPAAAGTIDKTGQITWNNSYTGSATIKIVVSNTECGTETKEAEYTTTITSTPEVSPIAGDSLVCRGNIVVYQVIPQAGTTYNWSINTHATIDKDDSKGMITVIYLEDLSKEGATLTVTPESEGCGLGEPQTKTINKDNGCDLFVPNILTTNTGDKNSVWQLEGVDNYPKMSIEIFNRWGAKVHSHSGKYDKPWDGTTGGQPLPTATYYYVIDKNDGTDKITGSVTVVRE